MKNNILLQKIEKTSSLICVVGLGQVGLPTALTFCKAGFNVIGVDINKKVLNLINRKQPPFEEKGINKLLSECIDKKKFSTSGNLKNAVTNSDIIIICVPTPITENILPNLAFLKKVIVDLSKIQIQQKLIVIESSIPPGTFENMIKILSKEKKIGKDFFACFIPERLSPGQALSEIKKTPRIIGELDEHSGYFAKTLYKKIVKSQVIVTSSKVAEVSKLVENTFRDVNIALANEVSIISEKYGIDVKELIKIANSHPRVHLLMPGPGVGGPCLPKDPYLLLNPQGMKPITSKLITNSRRINDEMPYIVVSKTLNILKNSNISPKNSNILVLGVSYKANVSDTRYSPANQIISGLVKNFCTVYVYDPFSTETFGGKSISKISDVIAKIDCIIIITDHDEFNKLNLRELKEQAKENLSIVDTRRMFNNLEIENLGIKYVSLGYDKSMNSRKKDSR